jgi:hypothetical protein
LTPAGAEEKPSRLSQPSLIVTPASSMAFSGPHGGHSHQHILSFE